MDLETDPGWQTGRQPFPLTVGEQVEVGADRADRPLMVEAWCTGHLHPRLPGWPTIPTMSPYGLPGFRGGPLRGQCDSARMASATTATRSSAVTVAGRSLTWPSPTSMTRHAPSV